jgi:hypothetical protein
MQMPFGISIMRVSCQALLVTLCLLAAPRTVMATEWFVASGGNGSGTSPEPFGRIQQALEMARPGDVVSVRPGVYIESIQTVRDGLPRDPIIVRGVPGAVIVTARDTVLTIAHAYHVFEGFVFDAQYAQADAVKVKTAAHYLVLRQLEVRRSTRDCIDIGSPHDVLIERSLIHHCLNPASGRTDAHALVAGAIRNLTIRDTEFHTFSGDGVQLDPARAAPGWDDVTIERCVFWLRPLEEPENGFGVGIVPGENAIDTKTSATSGRASITIRDTVARGFRSPLVRHMAAFNLKERVHAVLDRVTVTDSEIAFRLRGPALVDIQNAVIDRVDIGVRYEDNIERIQLWNSTFGRVGRAFHKAEAVKDAFNTRNLLFLADTLPDEVTGSGNLAVGPKAFRNADEGDYRLAAGSPAIDAGQPANVVVDREGVQRPQGAGYDAGAYELAGSR